MFELEFQNRIGACHLVFYGFLLVADQTIQLLSVSGYGLDGRMSLRIHGWIQVARTIQQKDLGLELEHTYVKTCYMDI